MDLIKHGSNNLGFRGAMGRTHQSRSRGPSRKSGGQVYLIESGGSTRRLKFSTIAGGAFAKVAEQVTVSFFRRNTTPQWLCKVYLNTTNVGGTINSGTSKTLEQFAATFNGITTDSLNSKIRCTVLSEVNDNFHSSVNVGDGAQLVSN